MSDSNEKILSQNDDFGGMFAVGAERHGASAG